MDFAPYQKMFRSWNFISFDLEKLPIERNDFIYADPPYDVEFTTYRAGGLSWDAFAALLKRFPLPPAVVVHSVCRA